MKKRTMIFVTAMVLLFAMVTGATLAYMTDTADPVTNTFSYGNIVITLDEKDVDNSTANADRDTANKYKLIAGSTYDKDPTVHIAAGSENCYLFVVVENGIANMEAGDTDKPTIATQMENNGWVNVKDTNLWYYNSIITTSNAVVDKILFNKVYLSNSIAGSNDSDIYVEIEAYAVQSENMLDDSTGNPSAIAAYKKAGAPTGIKVTWPDAASVN